MKSFLNTLYLILYFAILTVVATSTVQAATVNLQGYAWSPNIGWVSFNPTPVGGVSYDSVTGNLSGYAWSPNVGWFQFGSLSSFPSGLNTSGFDAKLLTPASSDSVVQGWFKALSASGSSGWDGWNSLSGSTTAGTSYGVTKNGSNFQGYSWGGDVVGWMQWNPDCTGFGSPSECGVTTSDTPIVATCQANRNTAPIGVTVTWSVNNPSGGNGTYSYLWSGAGTAPTLAGQTGQSANTTYGSDGLQPASVNITSGSQNLSVNCTVPAGDVSGVDVYTVDPLIQCKDGVDNDLINDYDYGQDPNCSSFSDTTESLQADTKPSFNYFQTKDSGKPDSSYSTSTLLGTSTPVTLRWSVNDGGTTTACVGSGFSAWNGSGKGLSGTQSVSMGTSSVTFVLTCSNYVGSASAKARASILNFKEF